MGHGTWDMGSRSLAGWGYEGWAGRAAPIRGADSATHARGSCTTAGAWGPRWWSQLGMQAETEVIAGWVMLLVPWRNRQRTQRVTKCPSMSLGAPGQQAATAGTHVVGRASQPKAAHGGCMCDGGGGTRLRAWPHVVGFGDRGEHRDPEQLVHHPRRLDPVPHT